MLRGEPELDRILTIVIAALGLLLATAGMAQSTGYSARAWDSITLSVQAKAEELFDRGDYRRAHFIYRNELAPIGDKYAQYMVGYMSLAGLGVEEDPIEASAWYRLAAERNAKEFAAVRDELMDQFDDIDAARSDTAYIGLRKMYSDIVLRMQLVRQDFELLSGFKTGSRVGRSVSPVTVISPGGGSSRSGAAYEREILGRMERRLLFITDELGIDPVDPELAESELRRLESLVDEHVSQVQDR